MLLFVKTKVGFSVELTQHMDDIFSKITQLKSTNMEIAV